MSAETQTAVVAATDEQEIATVVAGEVAVDEAFDRQPVELFELDFPENKIGGALAFAAVAALGLVLAAFATPIVVVICGWLLVASGAVAAARALGGAR